MAKHGKRSIFAILLALCIACSAGVLAACGDKNDGAVTYTVTVLKDDNTAASGVRVAVKKGSATFENKNTDANGKVSFALASDTYTIALSKLPEHYELPADADLTLTPQKTSLTVTLAPKNSYTINLINPDGTPFTAQTDGLDVVVCTLTGNCLEPVAPDANGTAVKEVEKGDYHVKIEGLQAGYIYERDADGYYTGSNLSESITEISIKIYPISVIDLTPMTTEQLNAFYASDDSRKNSFAAETAGKTVYEMSVASIPVNGYAYFSFTPQFSGKYNLWENDNVALYCTDTFKGEPTDKETAQRTVIFAKDQTYYFAFKNVTESAASAKRAIVVPTTSYVTYNGAGGTLEVTISDNNSNAIIRFAPPAAAKYKLTAQGTAPALVKTLSYDPINMEIDPTPAPSDYVAGANAEAYYASWDLSSHSYLYFAVAVQASTYPATVQVKLEKSGEKSESDTDAVAHDLVQYAPDTTGKELVGVPMDGTATLTYNNTTKSYTYDGKEVVVMLKEKVGADRFSIGEPLAYLDKENSLSLINL
ncbi:MAG: hypothetical protein K2M95_00425 [Clostridiales bacterium]|nr:hypothetical protein [Clostridiales bacterium]